VETARAHLVSKEDVGHGTASASRNDGYARRSKLRVASSNAGGSMRKANNGEVEGEDEDGTNEDEDQTEEDADATENEDYGMSGKSVLSRQDSNVSGQTDMSIDSPSTSRAGLRVAGSSSMKRKRTTSELSTGTILSTIEQDNDEDEVVYPRKRMDRRLSNENGLLRYDQRVVEVDEDIDVAEYSKAIESSSEDEAVVLDDDSTDDEATNADEALDDLDIEEEEEALILEEEELRDFTGTAASSVVGADSDIELPSDLDLGFLNSEMDDVFDAGESFFFRGMHSDQETPRRKKSDASARRVRFQDEIDIAQANTYSASTTSSETDIDIFPDLLDNPFKSQDELPANLRSQIEDEEDAEVGNGASSDGEGSVWDFGEEKASENFFAWHDEAGSDSDDSGSDLSGYDSDGDTTDDDLPPPSTIRAPKSLLHSRTPSTVTTEIATPKPFPRNSRRRRGPIMGSFIVDEKKAMAFIDPNTKQLRIQPARIPYTDPFNSTASSVNNSPQVNFNGMTYDSDQSDFPRLITGPSDVMMSGVFGGMPGQRYEDGRFVMEANNGPLLIGPPEAFYPFTSIRTDGTPEEEDDYDTEEEFEDDVDLITAFLDMEDDDEDEPEFFDDEITSPATTDAPDSTPAGPRSMAQMLDHLDRGVVSSFRNHQDRHRHVSQLPHDFNQDSTPIRDGRTADDVMTPLRKRKGGGILKNKTPRRMPVMGGFS